MYNDSLTALKLVGVGDKLTKSEEKREAKSKLPIWIGAISAPLIFNGSILLIWPGYYGGPNGLDFQTLLLSILIPLIFGALVGMLGRRIAKSQGIAILITVIGNALAVGACFLSLLVLIIVIAVNNP